jgi:Tfp pilus assembly protein PilV
MIAMVLLGIAVTALSSAGVYVVAMQTDSQVRSAATAIASSYLEQVKTREPTQVVSESTVKINEDGVDDNTGPFSRSVEVTDEAGLENTKRVTVKVEYRSGRGRTGTVELVTILYEGVDK